MTVMSNSKSNRPLFRGVLLATVFLVGVPGLPTASSRQEPPQGPPQQAPNGHYQRWLTEEVPYIITQEEKAMFAKLTTDKDREKFIREFWERRNPKPGSSENAFEKEYYARLAYARQHFRYPATDARDDRARIYILYGAPNKIEPAVPQNPKLTGLKETWIYDRIEGIGDHVAVQFSGASGSAEYRVVNDPEALRRPSARTGRIGPVQQAGNRGAHLHLARCS